MVQRSPDSLRPHEAHEQVPLKMPDEQWQGFLEDVRQRGVVEPILVDGEGRILDGVHRWRAAMEVGLSQVPVRVVSGVEELGYGSVEELIVHKALRRRHLTPDQQAVLAVRLLELRVAQSYRERAQKAARGRWGGEMPQTGHREVRTRTEVAREAGVSEQKLWAAQRLSRQNPQLAQRVLEGKLPLREAQRLASPTPVQEPQSAADEPLTYPSSQHEPLTYRRFDGAVVVYGPGGPLVQPPPGPEWLRVPGRDLAKAAVLLVRALGPEGARELARLLQEEAAKAEGASG